MATTDRKQAAQVALAIRDSALQSAALAALAPIFVEGPKEEIVSWINYVSRCLESIEPAAPKLRGHLRESLVAAMYVRQASR